MRNGLETTGTRLAFVRGSMCPLPRLQQPLGARVPMIVPIYPPLDGEAGERFHEFAIKLADAQRARSAEGMNRALEAEIDWCRVREGLRREAVGLRSVCQGSVGPDAPSLAYRRAGLRIRA